MQARDNVTRFMACFIYPLDLPVRGLVALLNLVRINQILAFVAHLDSHPHRHKRSSAMARVLFLYF
ncbi:MAG: hypothetical protein MESAZ_01034 [Saezia sanguinis]